MEKIIIIGATSSIAEQCTRLLVQNKKVDLILVGRNTARMEQIAADLRIRSSKSIINTAQADFLDAASIQNTVDTLVNHQPVDLVLIAHGSLPDQTTCQDNLTLCKDTLEINAISPVLYAEAFAQSMAKFNHGTLAVISSVAGDRGRKSNYVYGAAKGLVTRYVEGLQHRFANTKVKIILIKPGPTDTPMTAHLKGEGLKLAPVDEVAKNIVTGIEQGKSVIYVPSKWRLIMFVISHLPAFIFNKLNI